MKKLSYIIAVLLFVLQYSSVYAQTEEAEMRLSVCVGEERLENLLTEEQKDNVTHLSITGTMTMEDYACLHRIFQKKLYELNLRDADIDTIPAHAMEWDGCYSALSSKKIILPSKLEVLGDSSLCMHSIKLTLVLTGKFPQFGKYVFLPDGYIYDICFEISPDNGFCKEEDGGIYSIDGDTLYYYNILNYPEGINDFDGEIKIVDGTKIINGGAFECRYNENFLPIEIPETVDSIGDRAFAYYSTPVATGYWPPTIWPRVYCMKKTPPALGKDVFYMCQHEFALIVPDEESAKLYRTTEGWDWFRHIWAIDNIGGSGIGQIQTDGNVSVAEEETRYVIGSRTDILRSLLYDVGGAVIMSKDNCGKELVVDKAMLKFPYTILRIYYENGTSETVKLKP